MNNNTSNGTDFYCVVLVGFCALTQANVTRCSLAVQGLVTCCLTTLLPKVVLEGLQHRYSVTVVH